jgi:hypothetical protein
MRYALTAALAALSIIAAPGRVQAQTSIDGFGSLTMSRFSSLTEGGVPFDFGGRVGFEVAPGIQLLGEFGRVGNVLPEVVSLPLSFVPVDVRVSAFYGEGGVRLLAAPRSAVSPYVEGTAGVAHLQLGVSGLGPTGDAIARAALNFVDTREPIFGAGGGILFHGGPLRFDVGYRYKRIMTDGGLGSILGAGQGLQAHQVRFGVGVGF